MLKHVGMTAASDDSLRPALVFDLDGTLVDSNYQHALAWQEGLAAVGIAMPVWLIHRRIGVSGGILANELARHTAQH